MDYSVNMICIYCNSLPLILIYRLHRFFHILNGALGPIFDA